MSLVRFDSNGEVVFIYEDDHPILELGSPVIKRASHVEPTEHGVWQADMSPLLGPMLESTLTRADSLEAEKQWIERAMF